MEATPVHIPLGEGATLTQICDKKFRHNRITAAFILPLAEETASEYAILPFLLRKGCRSCPDFTSLNRRLSALYGASLDGYVSRYNCYQILAISAYGIDNRFALDDEDVVSEMANLLCDIVLDPNFNAETAFPDTDTTLERQFLIDTIEAEINDKRTYAVQQCMTAMCNGEPVAVQRYGSTASAAAITAKSAAEAWRRMVEAAKIEIFFTGPGDANHTAELFRNRLASIVRKPHSLALATLRDHADNIRELAEEMDLQQAKLVMGLRCAGISTTEDSVAARVFSAMLGGTPFSKLFVNVREKLSLCYYCSSHLDLSNKLMMIDSGVEQENASTARKEILCQLEAMQNGDFTAEELYNTKLIMKNSLMSLTDHLSSIESWYLTRSLRGNILSPQQDCELIDAVTAEDVMRIAKGVTLDTVYLLCRKENA